MITIYTKKSSTPCRNAIMWLQENNIAYQERLVTKQFPLTEEELIRILSLSGDIYEIVSTKRKAYQDFNRDIEEMSLKSEVIPFVLDNIEVLFWPIAIQGNKIHTGFNKKSFRGFIPRR